jgi:hypothetical protein
MADVVQMLAEFGPAGRTGKIDVKDYFGQKPKHVAV